LKELVEDAIDNNITLKQSKINLNISKAKQHSARVSYLPDLSAGFNHSEILKYDSRYDRLNKSDTLSVSSDNMYFTVSKSIALNNTSYFTNKEANHNFKLAVIDNEIQIQNVLYQIITSYISVLENQKRKELLENNILVQENIVSESRSLYRQAKITQIQLQQSEINLLNARISLLNTQNTLNLNRKKLFDLINIEDKGYILNEVSLYINEDIFQRELNLNRVYRIQQQEETIRKLRTNIRQTQLDFAPQLNLQYRLNRNLDIDTQNTYGNTSHTIGLYLSYSLNGLFRNYYSHRVNKLLDVQNELKTSQLVKDIMLDFDQYLEELNYLMQLDILLENRKQQAAENLAIAQQRYRLGLETQLDLEKASYENLEAEKAKEDNRYQLIRTKLNIDHLLCNEFQF